jgi:hypothetical protein
MKTLKLLSAFLMAMFTVASAYAGSNADYTKTVTGQGGALFSLSKGDAAALEASFDAVPKIYLYKYTGSKLKDIYKLGLDRGNEKSPHGRIIFPTVISNQDYHLFELNLPSANEGVMQVGIDDLDLMEIGLKKQFADMEIEFKKMGIAMPATPPPGSQKAQALSIHRQMYGVAMQSKRLDFRISKKFAAIDDAYVEFKPEESFFTGTVHGRYLFKIKLIGIQGLGSCDDVEKYIDNYVSQISFSGMPSSTDNK